MSSKSTFDCGKYLGRSFSVDDNRGLHSHWWHQGNFWLKESLKVQVLSCMFTCQWNVHFLNMVEHVLQKHVWELKTLCQSKLLLIIEEIFKSMHFHGCSHFSRMYTFSLSVEKHVLGRRELNYVCCKTNFCFKLKSFNTSMHFCVCSHFSGMNTF